MKRPILIIGAMNLEVNFLINQLQNLKRDKLSIYNVYEGIIKSYPIVIAQSEVGVINSASLTTLAIEKYNPILIINHGTAGGYLRDIHKGDIVIGEECFNIMSAKTPSKEENEGSNSLEWEYITFTNGKTDKKKTIKADDRLVKFVEERKEIYLEGNVYTGIIGSGDIWNCEKDKIIYLNKEHDVLCEEMEGISVYTVANNYNIPVVGVRVISNNTILEEEYDETLGLKCQEFIYKIVQDLIQEIGMFG